MSEGVSPSPRGTRPGFAVHTHNLIGGLTVAVLALLMLGYAFYVPNAVIPRLMSAALVLIGIVTAVGFVPVHAPRDLYGGIALAMLATLALIASAELPGQRGFAFGPGTAWLRELSRPPFGDGRPFQPGSPLLERAANRFRLRFPGEPRDLRCQPFDFGVL